MLDTTFLLSLTIVIPFIILLVRRKQNETAYRPFLWLMTVGVAAELISKILLSYFNVSNAVCSNIYVLAEALLVLLLFFNWKVINRNTLYTLSVFLAAGWIIENLVLQKLFVFSPYYRVTACFIIVILSIRQISILITQERNLLSNARFIICIGFIVLFVYKIIYEGVYAISVMRESAFADVVIDMYSYINAGINLVFGIGAWLIPLKRKFDI